MNIKNIKIGTRLGTAFGIVLLMLVAVAVLGMSRMAAMQQSMTEITRGNNVEADMAADMRATVADRMIALRNIVLLDNPAEMQKEVARVRKQASAYDEAEKTLRSAFATFGILAEESALLAEIKDKNIAAQPLIEKVLSLGLANKTPEAIQVLTGELRSVQHQWDTGLQTLETSEKKQNEAAIAAAENAYAFARNLMAGLCAAAVLLGLGLAWMITRSITQPINRAVKIAQTVAAGDLTSTIEVSSIDETGILLGALKSMNDNLKTIVGQVRAGTDTMSTASQEIAAGNLDLSSRTEEQASSLEETASSMEELTSTVKQNADNANQAKTLAASASDVASKGGEVVGQVVGTMNAISEASKKIADIISVIDGIAFQTNILALNAAVEAARAGEQGRGFAVVATEVRNLAHRSASAAKEIKTLITDSVEKVEAGTRLADLAGSTMHEVVDSVRRVSDIISEITAASREQNLGIDQINQAIMQMDSVTQQNAALVEQSAAAAESLHTQADQLTQVVSMFILDQYTLPQAPVAMNSKKVTQAMPLKPVLKLAASRGAAAKPALVKKPAKVSAGAAGGDWEEF